MTTKGDAIRDSICEYIASYWQEHQYPPSIREIGAHVGLVSPSTVHVHLRRLIADGRIEVVPGTARTIRLVA